MTRYLLATGVAKPTTGAVRLLAQLRLLPACSGRRIKVSELISLVLSPGFRLVVRPAVIIQIVAVVRPSLI